jgi:hypothetical protein
MGGDMEQSSRETPRQEPKWSRPLGMDKGKIRIADDFGEIPPEWDIFSDEFWDEREERKPNPALIDILADMVEAALDRRKAGEDDAQTFDKHRRTSGR